MRRARTRRSLIALAALGLGGCVEPQAPVGPMRLVSAHEHRVELSADGRAVIVAPPPGDCLASDKVHVVGGAAVTLMTACDASPGDAVQTVTIAAEPLFGARGAALELAALEAHLRGPQGRRGLGLSGDAPTRVVASRRDGATLYLVIEDAAAPEALLCRAFTEVNGRLAMVSASAAAGEGERALLRRAEAMVGALKAVNAVAERFGPEPAPRPQRA